MKTFTLRMMISTARIVVPALRSEQFKPQTMNKTSRAMVQSSRFSVQNRQRSAAENKLKFGL